MKKFLIAVALLLLPTLAFAQGKYQEEYKLGIGHKWRWAGDPAEVKTDVVLLAQADFCLSKQNNLYLVIRGDHGLTKDAGGDLVVGVAFKF